MRHLPGPLLERLGRVHAVCYRIALCGAKPSPEEVIQKLHVATCFTSLSLEVIENYI